MDDDLRTFVRRVSDLLAEEPEMSTRNVQLRIVEPLLSMLGWDVRAPEVEAERSLDTLDDPVDYVLLVDDRPDIAVRTIAADESITEDSVAIFARGIVSTGIDLGIVSNGHRFAFITTDGTEIKWTLCEADELTEHESILTHFTQAMATQRLATQVQARQRAAARLQENRAAVTEGVARELQSVAGEPLDGELRTLSRVILDVAIERFSEGDSPIDSDHTTPTLGDPDTSTPATDAGSESESAAPASSTTDEGTTETQPQQPQPPQADASTAERDAETRTQQAESTASAETAGDTPTEQPASPTPSTPAAGESEATTAQQAASTEPPDQTTDETHTTGNVTDPIARAREQEPDEEYVVRFFNERTGVGAIGNPTPQGALAGTIEYLCQQRALDNYLSLPWGVKDGQALLTREPEHPDGTPMEPAHELDNGYYLWTAIGTDACRSTVKDLAENLGLRVMFQGDWN
jgi:hypothetical protein